MVARWEGGGRKRKKPGRMPGLLVFGGGDQMAFLLEITVDRGFGKKLTQVPWVAQLRERAAYAQPAFAEDQMAFLIAPSAVTFKCGDALSKTACVFSS